MKYEKTAKAVSEIDESFIAEADEALILKERLRKKRLQRLCSAAACLVLAVGIITAVYSGSNRVLVNGEALGKATALISNVLPRSASVPFGETDINGETVELYLEFKKETQLSCDASEISVSADNGVERTLNTGEKISIKGKARVKIYVPKGITEITVKTDGGYDLHLFRDAQTSLWYAEKNDN